jgi:hypothetical protein
MEHHMPKNKRRSDAPQLVTPRLDAAQQLPHTFDQLLLAQQIKLGKGSRPKRALGMHAHRRNGRSR